MRYSTAALLGLVAVQQAAACDICGWGQALGLPSCQNSCNSCTQQQQQGLDFSQCPLGSSSYGGLDFGGCSIGSWLGLKKRQSFIPRGGKRSLGDLDVLFDEKKSELSKRNDLCALGALTSGGGPSFSCGAGTNAFSISNMLISCDHDTPVQLTYSYNSGPQAGQTCQQTAQLTAGSPQTITNTQCGGAHSVQCALAPAAPVQSCNLGIHSVNFDCSGCGGGSGPTQPAPPPAAASTAPPAPPPAAPSSPAPAPPPAAPSVPAPAPPPAASSSPAPAPPPVAPSVPAPAPPPAAPSVPAPAPPPAASSVPASAPPPPAVTPPSSAPPPAVTPPASAPPPAVTPPASAPPPAVTPPASSLPPAVPSVPTFSPSTIISTSVSISISTNVSSASFSVPTYPSNGSLVVIQSTQPLITTEVVYTTLTSCNSYNTITQGNYTSIQTVPTLSTLFVTSTQTVCTKCTAPPQTVSPASTIATTISVSSTVQSVVVTQSVAVSTSVQAAPAPSLLPSCLQTWIKLTGCKDNSDSNCFCNDANFTKNVQECVSAWSNHKDQEAQALSYLAGICAPHIGNNPGIITNIPSTITLQPTPAPTTVVTSGAPAAPGGQTAGAAQPVTTISLSTTVTVQCSAASELSGSALSAALATMAPGCSSVSVLSTQVTVPQVAFTTAQPGKVGLIAGTPAPAPATATPPPSAPVYNNPNSPVAPVSIPPPAAAPAGTGSLTPYHSPSASVQPFTGAAANLGGSSVFVAIMVAVAGFIVL